MHWWQLCPTRKVKLEINGEWVKVPAAPTEFELNAIRNDPVRLATIRLRLSDLSWWMRLLCQYIDERKDPLGPHASRNGKRSSDKGFLAMAEAESL
jgi:hypothetical protein